MTNNPVPKHVTPTTGLSLLELGDAAPEQVVIIRAILKNINSTHAQLWDEIQKSPPDKRLDRDVFEKTLEEMVQTKWLWKTGEGESAVYSGRLKKRYSRLRLRVGMSHHKPGAIFSSTWQMLEAKATVELEREKTTGATPTRPIAATKIKSTGAILSQAQKILLLMLFLSAINFFAVATIDVTGVSGFVETIGAKNLPWISIVEMILGLVVSGIYIQYADRMPSLRLMKIILGILVGVYAVTAALFFAAKYTHLLDGLAAVFHLTESTALLYPLLYLMRSQQIIVFPIAFWNLANSLYSMSDARKVFPIIASGEMIGGLIGYALFTALFGNSALFTRDNAFELLVLCGCLYLIILGVINFLKAPDDDDENEQEKESLIENFKDGLTTIQAVPLFRYLALTVALTWVTFPILEYHFYTSIDTMPGAQSGGFENFYSLYSIGLTLIPLLLQWQIVPALIKRVELRNAFIVLPVALAIGAFIMNLNSGVYIAAIMLLIGLTVYSSWDSPMVNTLQYLVPEDRRGRVGALLNNYAYAFGKIFGSLVLGIILSAGLSGNGNSNIYLIVALVAALGGVITSFLVRLTYEKSMLSWRVARRARAASMLDQLDDL